MKIWLGIMLCFWSGSFTSIFWTRASKMLMSSWKLCCSTFALKRGGISWIPFQKAHHRNFVFQISWHHFFRLLLDFVILPSPEYSIIKIPKKITKRQQVFFMVFIITWILISAHYEHVQILQTQLCKFWKFSVSGSTYFILSAFFYLLCSGNKF